MRATSWSEVIKDSLWGLAGLAVAVAAGLSIPVMLHLDAVLVSVESSAKTAGQTLTKLNATADKVNSTVGQLPAVIRDGFSSIQKVVISQGAALNGTLDRQATAFRTDFLIPQSNEYRALLNKHVWGIRQDFRPSVDNVNAMSYRFREASDILLDCKGKPNCLPSQTLAIAGTWRAVGGQITKATPKFISQVDAFLAQAQLTNIQFTGAVTEFRGIATDVHKVTTKYTAPQPWYKKVGAGAFTLGTAAVRAGAIP